MQLGVGHEAERKGKNGSADFLPASQWRQNKDALLESSQKILEALLAMSQIRVQGQQSPPPSEEVLATCFQQLSNSYDEEYGGFSESPKFPTPGQFGLCS